MKRLFLVALAAAAVWFAPATRAASTYYVSGSGSNANPGSSAAPFATIQKAADVAQPGDTIVVRAGMYAGARFSRSGTPAAPIVLRGEAGAVVNAPGPLNSNGDNIWVRNASWVTIEGLEVRAAGRAGIAVQAEPDDESHGVVLRDNVCHHNTRWGIFTAYAEGLLIVGNETSYSAVEHGIYISNSADNPVVRRNVVHHNHASGIQLNADPLLPGDKIISNALVEENVIYENGVGGGAAINLASVTDSRIVNNLLYDNRSSGIAGWDDGVGPQWGSHDNEFVHNTIVQASNGRWAVSLQNGSSDNTLRNNILLHLGTRGSVDIDSGSMEGLASDYNVIMDRFAVDEEFITAADWRAYGHDDNSVFGTTATLFESAASDDYRLRAGSPAVDAGTAAGAQVDLNGVWRPQGEGYDIGAYERPREADTPGVYAGASGSWFLRNSSSAGPAHATFGFGPAGAGLLPLAGDWDGDGDDTPGLYNPATGTFFLKYSAGPGPADLTFSFGRGGLRPVTGDWDGDGDDSIGVYDQATGAFFLKNTNAPGAADLSFRFGPAAAGFIPLAGDWDGDGDDTVGIYNQGSRVFFLKNANGPGAADHAFAYGPAGATAVSGDWNGDGADSIGVFVVSTRAWFLRNELGGGSADLAFTYGPANVTAVVGNWDGQ
jgi:hypothetical protein